MAQPSRAARRDRDATERPPWPNARASARRTRPRRNQAGEQPCGCRRVQPPAGGRRQQQEHRDPGRHDRRRQPVPAAHPHPAGARDRHVAEDQQQLDGEDGLDQGQRAEAQGGQLEQEAADHAAHAEQPDRLPGETKDEPDVEARRFAVPGADPLTYRCRGRAEARQHGKQDRFSIKKGEHPQAHGDSQRTLRFRRHAITALGRGHRAALAAPPPVRCYPVRCYPVPLPPASTHGAGSAAGRPAAAAARPATTSAWPAGSPGRTRSPSR